MEHEYYEFETIMNTELNKKIDRKNSGDFINKISETIDYLINKLKNEGFIENDINVSDILESINLKKIYYSVLIESVRNSIIHIPKNKDYSLDIKDNQIIFSYFHKKINKKIILYICLIILEGNIQKFHIIEKIYSELNAISSSKDIDFIDHTSYQLIESFTMSSSFKIDVIYIQSSASHKSLKLLTLPKKLMENLVSSTHMPEILPSNFKFDNPIDMMILSKQMKNGIASVKLSSKAKKALNISQNKKYRVNSDCLTIFREIDQLSYDEVKDLDINPFIPIKVFDHILSELDKLKLNFSDDDSVIVKKYLYDMKKNKKFSEKLNEIISIDTGVPLINVQSCREYYNLKNEYKKYVKLRKVHNTIVKFAETFDGFPLYFTESFDYRLRMYIYSYMFSRTSGIYKYLITDYDSIKLTFDGCKNMMRAFYKEYLNKKKKLILINNYEDLKKWNNIDIKELIKSKSSIYHTLLNITLKKLEKNNYETSFSIEIDQRTSSVVLMSVALMYEKLAEISNLSSKTDNDAPSIVMKNAGVWFKNKITEESNKILSESRSLQKSLLMCYCYNSTTYGRIKGLEEFIENKDDCKIIAKYYPEFIDSTLDGLSMKKDKLNNIIKYYLKNSQSSIVIDTIDGCMLNWIIFKTIQGSKKKKFKSVITGEHFSYDVKKTDHSYVCVNEMLRSFLASYIHSMDGALMRLIIIDVYDSIEYVISHLHDSVQIHPNYYDDVIKSIINVYTTNDLEESIFNNLFDRLRNNWIIDQRIEYDKLVEEFMSMRSEFKITKEKFNVEAMFRME
jgi:hypothetical protein